MLCDCTNLNDYMDHYGPRLAETARDALKPLHVPGRTPIAPGLGDLSRRPFEAQKHAVTGAVEALRRQKAIVLVGEMGTGKTLMGQAAVHLHAVGMPYRALVVCPGHLVGKWRREIKDTIPGAKVVTLPKCWDVHGLYKLRIQAPTGPTWYVISKETAKLDCKWRAAFVTTGRNVAACPSCGKVIMKGENLIDPALLASRRSKCPECGEPLWQKVREPNRFEPAMFIKRRLRGFFDYAIFDEVHELKGGANVAQANVLGRIAAAVKKVVALTGTIIGGKADDIRPLLFRLAPRSVIEEGFSWNEATAFIERYGRIDTVVREKSTAGDDNKMSSGNKRSVTKQPKPGIMPTLFGRHLIGNTIFLGLEEVADNLPSLEEQVIGVPMDSELDQAYRVVERKLMAQVREMARRSDKRLLSTMLNTLLLFPDHPFDWDAVGYHEAQGSRFVPVVQPANLLESDLRPKEEELLRICREERKQARQVWVFVQYTGDKDCAGRLERILTDKGFRTKVLRSTVPLVKREQWIADHSKDVDVMISHPKLVETGLDLFDRNGGHNFATLVFFQTGYNLYTMRQASRRAWRIGQPKHCRVFYLFYTGTMQARAMSLMGKKLSAALAIDGKFSSEGLAAMSDDDGIEMAMAKSLAENLDEDPSRAWGKVVSVGEPAIAESVSTKETNQFLQPVLTDEPLPTGQLCLWS